MHFRPSQSWFYFQSPFIITIDVKDANVEHEPQPPYNPKIPPPHSKLPQDPLYSNKLMQLYMQQNIPVKMNNPLAIQ